MTGILGLLGVAWHFRHQLAGAPPLRCVVATKETLAIKNAGKPAFFAKRRECVALTHDGYLLVFANGSRLAIHVHGASRRESDAFLASLYELWWRGLSIAEVQAHLTRSQPRIWPLLFMAILTIPAMALAVPRLDSTASLLAISSVVLGTLGASFAFMIWCFGRVRKRMETNQYLLHTQEDTKSPKDLTAL